MKRPNISPGRWEDGGTCVFIQNHPLNPGWRYCVLTMTTQEQNCDRTQQLADSKACAAVPLMMDALEARLESDKQSKQAVDAWDDSDVEGSRARISASVITKVLAQTKMREAMLAAGYTEE